jgi:hypothetical protein
MKYKLQGKWMWSAAIALSMGIAGCNLFHPTDSRDADSNDADALTLEGQKELQNSNYDAARNFFSKAIKADSSHSEAWVGLAKSVLHSQKGINVFELVSYAQTKETEDGKSESVFNTMPDVKADSISRGIDSVMIYLNKFIARDTTGKTDKKIRFRDIADSYTILQLTKAALRIRAVQNQMKEKLTLTSVVSADNSGMKMDLTVLSEMGDSLKPFLNDMAAAAEAIKVAPEAAAEIIKAYLPDSTRKDFDDDDYADVSVGLANTIIQMNDRAQSVEEDRNDVFYKFGNSRDDDGDGCVDEEVLDNYDNDGDGEIDEDVRDSRSIVLMRKRPQNYAELISTSHDATVYDLTKAQVDSVKFIEKYHPVDIDMNGVFGPVYEGDPESPPNDPYEWHYVYSDPNERDEQKNHLLQFTDKIKFKYTKNGLFLEKDNDPVMQDAEEIESLIKNKELIRKDSLYPPKYSLTDRQKMVGGCWNNYTEERFLQWFNRENAE